MTAPRRSNWVRRAARSPCAGGVPTQAARAATARRHDDRARWGLGFARIAADCVGGVVHPPVLDADGMRAAVFETGLGRLALPLALIGDGAVCKATRALDEETALLPRAASYPRRPRRRGASWPRTPPTRRECLGVEGSGTRTGGCRCTWVMKILLDGIVDRDGRRRLRRHGGRTRPAGGRRAGAQAFAHRRPGLDFGGGHVGREPNPRPRGRRGTRRAPEVEPGFGLCHSGAGVRWRRRD